jgi:hypothetical protein
MTRVDDVSCGSIWREAFLRGVVGRSGEVSFNLDIALPRLVAGEEREELGRSKESV